MMENCQCVELWSNRTLNNGNQLCILPLQEKTDLPVSLIVKNNDGLPHTKYKAEPNLYHYKLF